MPLICRYPSLSPKCRLLCGAVWMSTSSLATRTATSASGTPRSAMFSIFGTMSGWLSG